MKKTFLYSTLVFFVCFTIVLCGLWTKERTEYAGLENLCRYSAGRVQDRFVQYQQRGSEYDYRYGVSELVSFLNSYKLLIVETEGQTNTNCLYLNQLIGKLMGLPSLTSDQAGRLAEIGGLLSKDIRDETAYQKIFSLFNELDYPDADNEDA